ncbi:acyl-CoA dehydrogenase family protein [Streptomyces katsurahamanus]|uniref:Acyl-CoA dehydrogenase n=1 Tax=Streptomyces katsurahamanus TaxID=2577098 RepID=A0ABW9NSH1_9ACTN|nr:acyl-CoA dehydrogenase family protein [Streptomyces katsurahamanus]MQS35814.1 acyl-CoA dehydrogenase [Streptomyces katsurahamanus]
MRSLDAARDTCERFHPGLTKALDALAYDERERPGSPVIDLFRAHAGVGLLVPRSFGGSGADPLEAVRVMRALGSYSPSLAAGVTMHHFTVAMLYALADEAGGLTGAQRSLLTDVVPGQRLMASGWAEGRTGQSILTPSVTARPVDGGYLLNGAKKPCSLSRSMDLLTASIALDRPDGGSDLALALVSADSPGLSVHPFWGNEVLAAAETDEVRLEDVHVPTELVIRSDGDDPERIEELQTAGFIWFELLISSGYAGAATALVEKAVRQNRGSVTDRAALAVSCEAAFALLEGVARAVRDGLGGEEAVAAVLTARFSAQRTFVRVAADALELLGGMDFILSSESSRIATSVRPLAFHPPSRGSSAEALLSYFGGGRLVLG